MQFDEYKALASCIISDFLSISCGERNEIGRASELYFCFLT